VTEQPSSAAKFTGDRHNSPARSSLRQPAVRRAALHLLSAAVVVTGAATFILGSPAMAIAASPTVPEAELLKPTPGLPDLIYGNRNAKITIVEYASMTCPHCARFHTNVFPKLKKKYLDNKNGNVRLIFREFPLDNLAAGASMLARCAGNTSTEKTKKMIDILFARQRSWAFVRSNPLPPLFAIVKQLGFTQDWFNKCLKKQNLLSAISKQRARASKQFGVNSTPHFFVNGRRMGAASLQDFDKAISALK